MFKILLADNDPTDVKLYTSFIEKKGFSVYSAADAEETVRLLGNHFVDILIAEMLIPDIGGVEMVRQIRKTNPNLPIIMIGAQAQIIDKKRAYTAGVDDYMVKPIELEELYLRIHALLRRVNVANAKRLYLGNTVVDMDAYVVYNDVCKIKLSKKEFEILFKLLSSPNVIFTRQQIMDDLWGYGNDSTDRTVDVHIRRIREKLNLFHDFSITTVHGLGYKGEIHEETAQE